MTHGSHPDVPNPGWPMETYLGERNGNPYCLAVYAAGLRGRDFDWVFRAVWPSNRKASLLGQCRLPARYGMPGPEIMEWLEAGGMSLATGSDPDAYLGLGWRRPWGAAQTPFAMRRAQRDESWRRDVDVDRCITGDVAACARMLTPQHLGKALDPQFQAVVSSTRTYSRNWRRSLEAIDSSISGRLSSPSSERSRMRSESRPGCGCHSG
jgi:hypothetical protein